MPRITDFLIKDLEERLATATEADAPAIRAELESAKAAKARANTMNAYLRGTSE